jgi:hypothetical protein
MLAGDANVNARRAIMSTLAGHKVPRAKAGINAIRQAFYAISSITGTCLNDQENKFIEWARLQTSVK